MKVPTQIFSIGKDYNGYLWFFDARERRVYVEGDLTQREERGYHCKSFQEAKRMLREKEIP
jgi:hypothetical protein